MTEHGATQSGAETRKHALEFPRGGGHGSAGSERERGRCVEEGSHAWEDPNPSCKTKVGISPATQRDSAWSKDGPAWSKDEWEPYGAGVFTFFRHLLPKTATMELTAYRDCPAVQARGSCSPTLFLLFLVSTLGESHGHKAPGWEG